MHSELDQREGFKARITSSPTQAPSSLPRATTATRTTLHVDKQGVYQLPLLKYEGGLIALFHSLKEQAGICHSFLLFHWAVPSHYAISDPHPVPMGV